MSEDDAGSPDGVLPTERDTPAAIERAAALLRGTLSAIQGIPRILFLVLAGSLLSGLGLAWFWFLRSEAALVRWLALPWLALLAAPQLGLWLLASSLRELLSLPDRLVALKSGLAEQGDLVLKKLRGVETEEVREGGFLTRVRRAYALHGELSQILASRAILHRFTGPLALAIGPISFALNGVVILVGLAQLALALP